MKKIVTKIAVILLALCVCALPVGCASGEYSHKHTFFDEWECDGTYHWHEASCAHSEEIDGKAKHTFVGQACSVCGYSKQGNVDNDDALYKASALGAVTKKCVAQANDTYFDDVTSFYDDNNNYWIFDMGVLVDMPLDDVFEYFKYTGGNVQHRYTVTRTEAETVRTATQEAASHSSNWSTSDSQSIGIKLDFGWNFNVEAGVSHVRNEGESDTLSWSKSFERCEEKSITEEQSVVITFDDDCPAGYYSYRYIGAVDVYAAIIQNRNTKEFSISTYTKVRAFGYSLDYDPDSLRFDNYDDSKLEFDFSLLNGLKAPTKYIEFPQTQVKEPVIIFNDKIRTGEETVYIRHNYIKDTVQFACETPYADLVKDGYTKAAIRLYVDIAEVCTSGDLFNGVKTVDKSGQCLNDWRLFPRHQGNWQTYTIDINDIAIDRIYRDDIEKYFFTVTYYCLEHHYQDWKVGTVRAKVILSTDD